MLISHRFSSVRMADRIVVLKDGTVEAEARTRSCYSNAGGMRSCSICGR